MELKDKIFEYKERIAKLHEMEQNKDDFIKAIRKFMEMQTLTALFPSAPDGDMVSYVVVEIYSR